MKDWAITVSVEIPDHPDDVLIEAAEAYLDRLAEIPGVLGPVASTHLGDRSISARFTIEAENFAAATRLAADLIEASMQAPGLSDAIVAGLGVMDEAAFSHGLERELAYA